MHRWTMLLFLGMALTRCASMGTKVEADRLTQFERGKTTYTEVIAMLGKPTSMTLAADGSRQLTYA